MTDGPWASQPSLQRWSRVCCNKFPKPNRSPLLFKMTWVALSGPGLSHLHQKPRAPGEPALWEASSSLTATALQDAGVTPWRRFREKRWELSTQENVLSRMAEHCKYYSFPQGNRKEVQRQIWRTPRLGGIVLSQVISCQNEFGVFFFPCRLTSIISRQIRVNGTVSTSVRRGRCTRCITVFPSLASSWLMFEPQAQRLLGMCRCGEAFCECNCEQEALLLFVVIPRFGQLFISCTQRSLSERKLFETCALLRGMFRSTLPWTLRDQVLLFVTSCRVSTLHLGCSVDLCEHIQRSGTQGTRQSNRHDWECGSFWRHAGHTSQLEGLFL